MASTQQSSLQLKTAEAGLNEQGDDSKGASAPWMSKKRLYIAGAAAFCICGVLALTLGLIFTNKGMLPMHHSALHGETKDI